MWEAEPDVLVSDLGDELILLQPESSQMFQLNGSGRAAWLVLPGTVEQVVAVLLQAFEVTPAQAQADAQALLNDLRVKHLIRQK